MRSLVREKKNIEGDERNASIGSALWRSCWKEWQNHYAGAPWEKDKTSVVAGPEVESGGEMGGKLVHFDGLFVFAADDWLCATAEIMGKSGYGTTYKATLEDGNQVAVKRLREKTTKRQREFESEAFYLGPKGAKLLVFDYIPVGSLASYLHVLV
ncbi:hypothetical protein OIU85_014630 [Salix viminalis]|uniref:Protein kinase domain-containing protein n=1 Tax=Salix viminalis TaxID=40686 RepID=A0A9Q0NJG0_SALVM|nr:hypothetical protein OIU85_014630 [Salix viminalis]